MRKMAENCFYIIVFIAVLFIFQELSSGRYSRLKDRINELEVEIGELKHSIKYLEKDKLCTKPTSKESRSD